MNVVLAINNFNLENVGKYICKTSNSLGETSKEVSITIKLAPKVEVLPHELRLTEGTTGSFQCSVSGTQGDFLISWDIDLGTS